MGLFVGIAVALAKGLLGSFGSSFLSTVGQVINSKDLNLTTRWGFFLGTLSDAIHADVELAKGARQERVSLWSSWTFRFGIMLIIWPPAFWFAAVFADTLAPTWFPGTVNKPPEFIYQYAEKMLFAYMGVGTAASTVTDIVNKIWKR